MESRRDPGTRPAVSTEFRRRRAPQEIAARRETSHGYLRSPIFWAMMISAPIVWALAIYLCALIFTLSFPMR